MEMAPHRPGRGAWYSLAVLVLVLCVVRFGFRLYRFYGQQSGASSFSDEL